MEKDLQKWMVNIRRDFHMHPELGMEEFRTSKKIAEYLRKMDIEVIEGVAGTGVVGIIKGAHTGKTVALRADMDALSTEDTKNVSYKSLVPLKAHACGHDAHISMLLGAAKILKSKEDKLKGNVKLFFQPAEETVGGAKPMIEEGVMENPRVDVVFGLHVDPELETGSIGIKYGKMNAASDTFDIIVNGKASHGAYPQGGIDAIITSGHIANNLQTIVSRNIDPRDSAVITIGKISGGTAQNTICNKVKMSGMIRTLSPQTRKLFLERAKTVVEKTAEVFGAKGEFIRSEGYAALINDEFYVDIVRASGEKLLGKDNVILKKDVSLGVEDFSYFLQEAPGAFFTLGCRSKDKKEIYALHNSDFDIDEECLSIGALMHVENVMAVLNKEK